MNHFIDLPVLTNLLTGFSKSSFSGLIIINGFINDKGMIIKLKKGEAQIPFSFPPPFVLDILVLSFGNIQLNPGLFEELIEYGNWDFPYSNK